MRNAVLGGFLGTLLAIGVLVACGGSGGGSTQLGGAIGQFVVPARSMGWDPTGGPVTAHGSGFRWANSTSGGTVLTMPRPKNYDGGNVTVRFVFQKATGGSGTVAFFMRPRSFEPSDPFLDQVGVTGTPVDVTGFASLTLFRQEIVLPPDRLGESIWYLSIQRDATAGTYADDVFFLYAEFEYTPA